MQARMAHASRLGQKQREIAKVGNNNGRLRIATPPWVAHAKPPGPKKEEILNDSNNNVQLRIANATMAKTKASFPSTEAAWTKNNGQLRFHRSHLDQKLYVDGKRKRCENKYNHGWHQQVTKQKLLICYSTAQSHHMTLS